MRYSRQIYDGSKINTYVQGLENYHEVRYDGVTARALINTALLTVTRFALLYPSGPGRKECAYLYYLCVCKSGKNAECLNRLSY